MTYVFAGLKKNISFVVMTESLKSKTKTVLRKNKKVMLRLPKKHMPEIRSLMKERGIEKVQHLYDHFIVSGIVLRNPVVLDFFEENIQKYKDRAKESNMKRLQGEKAKKGEMYQVNCVMYPNDKVMLDRFVTDKNCKKSHLFELLLYEAFTAGNEEIDKFIESLQVRDVSRRKKAIARLSKDSYVEQLDESTRSSLLNKFTEKYDEEVERAARHAQELIEAIVEDEESEEDEIDRELNEKMKMLRRLRTREANKLAQPVDED